MTKKFVAKILVAVLLFSTMLTVRTYAGENDIPRLFQGVPVVQLAE